MENDLEIQVNVIEQLRSVPLINANEIGVAVKNGLVTLSGIVDSYPNKIAIEKAVKRISGVKGIAEDLEVHITEKYLKTDSEIAQIVMNAIEYQSLILIDKLKILVEGGFVTIEGFVDWDFQRKSLSKTIGNCIGVKGVINNIKISHTPTSSEIKSKIQAAFIRIANIDADKINILTQGNKVVLTGKVSCWSEYEEAERTVWDTPGVSSIENKLEFDDKL